MAKQCTQCGSVLGDDLFFCPNDGSTLHQLRAADGFHQNTVALSQTPQAMPKQSPGTPGIGSVSSASPVLFVIIGVLGAALIGAGVFIFVKLGQEENIKPTTSNSSSDVKASASSPAPSPTEKKTAQSPASSPTGFWSGDWKGKGAIFTATMELNNIGGQIEGKIDWTLVKSSNPRKMNLAGATSTEYVRGTYDADTRRLTLAGYREEDPSNITILDRYNLNLSGDERTLVGNSKSNGVFRLSR